jgi:2-haloacid dehalogenase
MSRAQDAQVNRVEDAPRGFFAVEAVACDVKTALLDSVTLWSAVAGDAARGAAWREAERRLIYGDTAYRPYLELLAAAAREVGLDAERVVPELARRWGDMRPWPDVPGFLAALGARRLALATNAAEALARVAAGILPRRADVVVSAERAGAYKPDPTIYGLTLQELRLPAERVLFLAGSPGDAAGAKAFGFPTVWVNRYALPPPTRMPDLVLRDLTVLTDHLR